MHRNRISICCLALVLVLPCLSFANDPEVSLANKGFAKLDKVAKEMLLNNKRNNERSPGTLPTIANLPLKQRAHLRAAKTLFAKEAPAKLFARFACCTMTKEEFVAMTSHHRDKKVLAIANELNDDAQAFYELTAERIKTIEAVAIKEEKALEEMFAKAASEIVDIWTE